MTGDKPASSAQYLAAAILLIIASLGAWCALTITGHDPSPLLGYLGLPIVGLLVAAKVDVSHAATITRLSEQDQVIGQISHNTNGVLTQRIRDAVNEALNAPVPESPSAATDPATE